MATPITIHPVPKTQAADAVANLHTISFSKSINQVFLSPDSRYLALIYADDTNAASTQNGLVIYDLQNQAAVNTINRRLVRDTGMSTTQIMNFSWLPSGEYRYIYRDARIMAGSVATPSQLDKPAGKMVAPAGYETTSEFTISPDGKKIATTFIGPRKSGGNEYPHEVWIADITGGNPQRLTAGEDAIRAVWSPDGQFLAVASGFIGSSVSQFGQICRRKYIPSTARNVTDEGSRQQIRYIPFEKPYVDNMSCPPIDFYWTE
jgi:WD40 repeat protein